MTESSNHIWAPQVGPQLLACVCPYDVVMYGGTRGGGKTDCAIGRHILGAAKHGAYWNGLMVRRKFKDFAEVRRRWDELIADGLQATRVGGDMQTNTIRFKNGAMVTLAAVLRKEMLSSFTGGQYTEITIDEAPSIPFIADVMDQLKGAMRSPHGVPCRMFLTGNPGGSGATIIRHIFIEKDPEGLGTAFVNKDGMTSCFIKSRLEDNKILCENDPLYVKRIRSITDPHLRAAWLDGNWDTFIGQAFEFFTDVHVINPLQIPENAEIYASFDWGFAKPFSWGWWWRDKDTDRLYRFGEYYGCDIVHDPDAMPNKGLGLSDSDIATKAIEKEKKLLLAYTGKDDRSRVLKRVAGHDCFSRKPNVTGRGQGIPTAEVFNRMGIPVVPNYPDRKLKIRQFRERLSYMIDENGNMVRHPMVLVYNTCKQFIRTVPTLCVDEDNPEDIDTEQEDHVYDEACNMFMTRPLHVTGFEDAQQITAGQDDRKLSNAEQAAQQEIVQLRERLETEAEYEQEALAEALGW